jgi:hypothetical protein
MGACPILRAQPPFHILQCCLSDDEIYRCAPGADLVISMAPDPEVVPTRALQVLEENPDLLVVAQYLPRLLSRRRSYAELYLVNTGAGISLDGQDCRSFSVTSFRGQLRGLA